MVTANLLSKRWSNKRGEGSCIRERLLPRSHIKTGSNWLVTFLRARYYHVCISGYFLRRRWRSSFCRVAENLAPSELKKLRNKQRKQRRKAELERQQAAQAQEKREQHNKSRQQNDPDLEQPTLDELIPEKLERVSMRDDRRMSLFLELAGPYRLIVGAIFFYTKDMQISAKYNFCNGN